jgi:5'-3' exonuclease
MTGERAYLVDASIYVFRAWFTLPETLTDRESRPVNAVYGFTDFVHRLLTEARPARLAFAFDESLISSHRNTIYPDYKANREEAPLELKHQFRLCRRFVSALGIAELASERYEADDLIATLADRERAAGHPVTIVSGDKDLTQLVEAPDDQWWEFARNVRHDRAGVEKAFGVRPEQIADQLAIAGDKIDNIPGVPGVGMATAAKLLRRFGSIDAMLADTEAIERMQVRGAARLRRLIETHRETIELSRRLTGLYRQAPIPEDLELAPRPGEREALLELIEQLGFGQARRERWLAWLE